MSPTAIEVFWKLHEGLSIQGPGSDRTTLRALNACPALPQDPAILDLGCGPGRQSLALARATGGTVLAIDLIPPFLEQTADRAKAASLDDRIETRQANMGDLDLADESFDLLWSEGAIYNIGFESGLRGWRRLLKPGCCVAVTEATWLDATPAKHVRKFWHTEYAAMQSRKANEHAVANAGYELLESFVLPASEWWDEYYTPIKKRLEVLRSERNDDTWLAAIETHAEEIQVVRDCADSFGYVFYIMQKPA